MVEVLVGRGNDIDILAHTNIVHRVPKRFRIIGYSSAIMLFLLAAAYSIYCSPYPSFAQKALFVPPLFISIWTIAGLMLLSGRIKKTGIQCNWLLSLIPWNAIDSIIVVENQKVKIEYDGDKSIFFYYDNVGTLELLQKGWKENRVLDEE